LEKSIAKAVPCREARGVCLYAIAKRIAQAREHFSTHTQLHRLARYCNFFISVLLSDAVIHHAMRACVM